MVLSEGLKDALAHRKICRISLEKNTVRKRGRSLMRRKSSVPALMMKRRSIYTGVKD
jgi:hypothetical protein